MSLPQALSKKRFGGALVFVSALFIIVTYQLFQLTIFRRAALLDLADKQHYLRVDEPALRGQILDRNGKELATNLKVPSIYAVPNILNQEDKEPLVKKLAGILKMDEKFIRERFSRSKSFVWLKRRTQYDVADKIRDLRSPAVGSIKEYRRFYPQGDLLAHVMGFTNIDTEGIEGLELQQNRELEGRSGKRLTKRDALGREIRAFEVKQTPVIDGNKITLTIDQYLQYITERALEKAYKQWRPKGAIAIIMEPKTGKILAMANRPTYDPNYVTGINADARRNRAVTDMYEPGSIFKIVAVSGALNEGKVTPETTFNCENGKYRYSRSRVLRDVHPYGQLTVSGVVIKSSNIGTVKIAAKMTPDVLQSYILKFGFGKATGIDLPGEAPGFTRPPAQWSNTSPYNIPIGQEVMVTPIQMVRAMAVIANGGNLVKPYIIEKIEDQSGVTLKENKPTVNPGVIRPEIAQQMREILTKVVEEGTGKSARIPGILSGGKTGTAQKVLPNGGGYSHSNFIGSFIGFAPSEDPQYVMAVMIDDPRPMYYGGVVAAPVFKEVMEMALLSKGYVPHNAQDMDSLKSVGGKSVSKNAPESQPKLLPTASGAREIPLR